MPPQPHRPDALAWQVFRGSEAVRRGLLTRHQLRGSAWLRVRHDVYADGRLRRDHLLACRAALLRLPPEAIIAGPSAAYLHGVRHAASFTDDVHVLVPRAGRVESPPGIRVHTIGADDGRGGRAGADGGLRWSAPAQAAWETAVWLEPSPAVAIVDTLLATGRTTRAALAEVAEHNAERPGGRRARWVFGLADPGATSPAESQLRVGLVLAGLPRPVTQHPVRGASGLVLRPDLAWPSFRVAIECDGHWHADAGQPHGIGQPHGVRQRLDHLAGAGWIVLHVTSRRLHRDLPGVVREVRAALVARGWRR